MKNLFAATLILLAVSTSSISFAADHHVEQEQTKDVIPAAVTISQMEKSKLDVVVENAVNTTMTIRLVDSFGQNIATKTVQVSPAGTRIRFDLSALTDGEYRVNVIDGKNSQLKKFELKTVVPSTPDQEIFIL